MKKIYAGVLFFIIAIALIAITSATHKNTNKVTASPTKNYVALGDSVSAGDGLETYSDSSACNRTNQSYPNIVASKLYLKLSSLSCSGATIEQGISGSQTVNQLALSSQLSQAYRILSKPDMISITIGANDVQWTDFITKCYSGQCGTSSDSSDAAVLLQTLNINLNNVLTSIKDHYGGVSPKVIVTGYYQIFPSSGSTCTDIKGITPSEIIWLLQQQDNLNTTIKSVVANYSFAKYAAIDFSGHELCTSDPWIQGLNDKAPYHPTDSGQTQYASAVIAAEKAFK